MVINNLIEAIIASQTKEEHPHEIINYLKEQFY